jgi:CheY-like chemotaxis protein
VADDSGARVTKIMSSSSVIEADPEHARLAVLHSYRIVDTPPEDQFDEITRLAIDLCKAEAAKLVLVGQTRCWSKAVVGLKHGEVPRELSFCNHAFLGDGIFVVKDARQDPRFSQIPIVARDGFNFFAGIPLIAPPGHSIGALCVLDREPRDLSDAQITALRMLSGRVMELLEQRRAVAAPANTSSPGGGEIKAKDKPVHLLIVDDDDAVRSFVCVASRRLGYQVADAANGVEALKQLANKSISVVLTDINMPIMDGLELVRNLKKQASPPAIAVMSGRYDPYIRSALKAEGINALLSKPFSTAELKHTLLRAQVEIKISQTARSTSGN